MARNPAVTGRLAALTPPKWGDRKAEILEGVDVPSGAFVIHAACYGERYFTDPFQRKVDKPSNNGISIH
jgi:hypothetical protein